MSVGSLPSASTYSSRLVQHSSLFAPLGTALGFFSGLALILARKRRIRVGGYVSSINPFAYAGYGGVLATVAAVLWALVPD